ncbi:IclR family transcriptional regulator C-terminal domain-containing protein [Streptomyces sp. NPDC005438]|uniref:IclR family transcriptional regulator n=1 Tax=Streptomyces sp. NPDC005438 TaxID=3156880 RepID=UPI0033A8739C
MAPFHSAQYALRILERVSRHPSGISHQDLRRAIDLPPGHLAHLLLMLRREGYLRQVEPEVYAVGESLMLLSSGGDREHALREQLRRALAGLRDSLRAAVYLSRYTDGEAEVTHCVDSPQAPAVHEWFDFRSAMHATAAGKCLLEQLDEDGRRDHLSRHRTARLTSRTITNERVLLGALDGHPVSAPMLDLQEYAVGTVCAAVPVTAGSAIGSLALSLPIGEAHRLRPTAEALRRQAAPVMLSLSI